MHFDGLSHIFFSRRPRVPRCRAAWEIGGERRVVPLGFFDDDEIPGHRSISFLKAGLLEDAAQRPGSQVIIPVTRDRHASFLDRARELAVTPSLDNLIPAVLPELFYDITNFHPITETERNGRDFRPWPR